MHWYLNSKSRNGDCNQPSASATLYDHPHHARRKESAEPISRTRAPPSRPSRRRQTLPLLSSARPGAGTDPGCAHAKSYQGHAKAWSPRRGGRAGPELMMHPFPVPSDRPYERAAGVPQARTRPVALAEQRTTSALCAERARIPRAARSLAVCVRPAHNAPCVEGAPTSPYFTSALYFP
ncbi:hypothetical protein NUW54_g10597 [Trametes sanguinea]|uniref:Uncharacterized protein n=1 Tax=Trametes sanguinea TaxID=158606 RepID=A0ACC1NY96_9APHY|nr:hypothetical protein NUW54_g10597 [Trametes sanguinea]